MAELPVPVDEPNDPDEQFSDYRGDRFAASDVPSVETDNEAVTMVSQKDSPERYIICDVDALEYVQRLNTTVR